MIVRLLAVLLLLNALSIAWQGGTLAWCAEAAIMAGTAWGLYTRKRWGQYGWHLISFATVVNWVCLNALSGMTGDKDYALVPDGPMALVPDLLLLVLCIGGSVAVARAYARERRERDPG